MDNVYGQAADRFTLQVTPAEALGGCVKEAMLGNQLYQVTIPMGTPTGTVFELRADNGFLLGTVTVQVTGSPDMAAQPQNAAAGMQYGAAASQNNAAGTQYAAAGMQYGAAAAQNNAGGTQYGGPAYGANGNAGAPAPKKKGKKTGLWITLGIIAFLAVGGFLFYNFYHVYDEPTCTEAAICRICHKEIKPALGHDWMEATYDDPQTCARCGETTGDVKGMIYEITGDWTDTQLTIGDWNYPIWGLDPPLEDVRKIKINIRFDELNADLYHVQMRSNGKWYQWDLKAVDGQTSYDEWFYMTTPMRIEQIAITDDSDKPYTVYISVDAAQCGK